jgi:hypothetical protein
MAQDAASASALASSTGQPVELLPYRTDWSETFAQPGGGFTTTESLVPVRVQRPDGSWVPVDTTLSARPDGSVAPGAILAGLSLSGGGSGPLFTLSQGSDSLSVSWPFGALPAPSLSGATATYANVLPGVNLLVTATPTGLQELIEVMTASAAANPALARITFPAAAPGLSVSADSQGSLAAADAAGNVVFTAPVPQMWDSAGTVVPGSASASAAQAAVSSSGPVPGDHVAVMGVSASAGSVSLTAAASVLAGSGTTYPVFIDPYWNVKTTNGASWADVWKHGDGSTGPGNWEFSTSAGGVRVGVYCQPDADGKCLHPTPDGTWGIYRSYLNFSLPGGFVNSNPDDIDSQLQLKESWSWSCTASDMSMWQTNYASGGLTWDQRPQELTRLETVTTAHGWSSQGPGGPSNCPPDWVKLNPHAALVAAGGPPAWSGDNITLELRATDPEESGWVVNSWKRLQADTIDLIMYWRHAPDAPDAAGTQGAFDAATGQATTACGSQASSPDHVNTVKPVLQATIDDPKDRTFDAANNITGTVNELNGEFSVTDQTVSPPSKAPDAAADNNPRSPVPGSGGGPSGATFTYAFTGTAGHEYSWQAHGETLSGVQTGVGQDKGVVLSGLRGPSSSCWFVIDTTHPTGTVLVRSDVYQDGVAAGAVGMPGHFTFTDPNYADPDSRLAGFFYGVGGAVTTGYVPAVNGSATVMITPFTTQNLPLYVEAVDIAGNPGPLGNAGQPSFTIVPASDSATQALGYWRLNGNPNGGSDLTGDGADVTLTSSGSYQCPAASLGASPAGYSCTLNGEADTARPVVSNEAAFSVSAWVNMSGCGASSASGYCVAMSEDAVKTSEFKLAWQGGCQSTQQGCWELQMRASDSQSVTLFTVPSAPGATGTNGGKWVQLTAVFDPNGTYQGQKGTITLYLNGGWAAEAGGILPWRSLPDGPLRIGAGFQGADPWAGNVSDACVFYGPLTQAQVTTLWAQGQGDGCAALDPSHL